MGIAARQRVIKHFSWTRIAGLTLDFYRETIARDREKST
jgi:glycosyltransferase involved in cell wall biosynthesis